MAVQALPPSGDAEVLAKLVEVGSKAAGKTLVKKEIYFFLEDIKETMKASKFVPAAPVVAEVASQELATQPAE